MKNFILLIFFIIVMSSLSACGDSGKSETSTSSNNGGQELSGELSIFNWGEYLPDEIVQEFEEEFGIDVVISTYNDNDEMLTKLKSGAVDYDLAAPTDWMVGRMIKEDLLLELDMENIPNFENIEEVFQEREYDQGNKFSVPYIFGSLGLVYNEKEIDRPSSWSDLWNQDYKDHVIVQETERAVISFTLQMLGYDYNNPSDDELAEAEEKLKELHPNVLAYNNTPAADLVSGQVWIAEAHSTEAAIAMKENPDLDYLLPEEGGILWMDNWVIPKTAQNKENAEAFLNFILRPEVSKRITGELGGSNPNAAAVELMSAEEKDNPASYPSEEMLKNATWYEYIEPEITQKMQYMWKTIRVQ